MKLTVKKTSIMSTPNFSRITFSNIYAFGADAEDQFEFQDELENIAYQLDAKIPDFSLVKDGNKVGQWQGDFFVIGKYDRILSNKWGVRYNVVVLNGYYSGANIEVLPEITDLTEGGYTEPEYLAKSIHARYQAGITKLEKAIAKFTTPLECVGVFSNGEAVYKPL